MKLRIVTPIKAFIDETTATVDDIYELRRQLTYTNTSVHHLIKRHHNNFFWKNKNVLSWQQHLENLQKDLKKTLLFQEDGKVYIRPGSIPYLSGFDLEVSNEIQYAEPKKVPWLKPLPFELHPYQEVSWKKLIEAKHGNVSLTTGSGKSAIILKTSKISPRNVTGLLESSGAGRLSLIYPKTIPRYSKAKLFVTPGTGSKLLILNTPSS